MPTTQTVDQIFPFSLYPDPDNDFAPPAGWEPYFLAVLPSNITSWYTFNVVINSIESVVFQVFDAPYTGASDAIIAEIPAIVPSVATENAIHARCVRLAGFKRNRELLEAEQAIIETYTNQFLAQVYA